MHCALLLSNPNWNSLQEHERKHNKAVVHVFSLERDDIPYNILFSLLLATTFFKTYSVSLMCYVI